MGENETMQLCHQQDTNASISRMGHPHEEGCATYLRATSSLVGGLEVT